MTAQLLRPTRVKWVFPQAALHIPEDLGWIESIPSKSVRTIARQLDAVLERSDLQYTISPLTAESYADWRAYYAQQMEVQRHEVLAKPEWFAVRSQEVPEILLVDLRQRRDDRRVGAAIIMRNHNNEWNKPYRASERLLLPRLKNLSVGVLLDLLSMRHIFAQQPTLVKSGASRNAFGHTNTLGYLTYKLKMGYEPWIYPEFSVEDSFPQLSPETPTAWFVVPESVVGKRERIHTLLIDSTEENISSELKKYLLHHDIVCEVKPKA